LASPKRFKMAKKEVLHWADQTAKRIIAENKDKNKYVIAAGITPSGTIHVGNFREMITVDLVNRALKDLVNASINLMQSIMKKLLKKFYLKLE